MFGFFDQLATQLTRFMVAVLEANNGRVGHCHVYVSLVSAPTLWRQR
jgi:hypothetical protein